MPSLAQPLKLFLSSTIWQRAGPTFISGRAHHSYDTARCRFEAALRYLDVEIYDVPRPEIYAAPVSRTFLDETSCHLIFKPAEEIRLLKGVRNIAWITWGFDRLSRPRTSSPQHPFADMRRMLALPDEIWASCEFAREVFRAAGISNVHRIPPPIAVPRMTAPIRFPNIPADLDNIPWVNLRIGFGRYGDINRSFPSRPRRLSDIILDFYGGAQPLVVVSVVNPHAPEKNLTALIGGFLEFHAQHPNSLLLLKLVVDHTKDCLDEMLSGALRSGMGEYELVDTDAIWLATAQLPEPVLVDLYRFSAAYLCSSMAEGQNPPLQEAMACGVVPITTRHTAMLDYISAYNAIIIRSQPSPIDRSDAAIAPDTDASWHSCTSADVAHALRRFARLGDDTRRELGARARAAIAADFSLGAVSRLIRGRLFGLQ